MRRNEKGNEMKYLNVPRQFNANPTTNLYILKYSSRKIASFVKKLNKIWISDLIRRKENLGEGEGALNAILRPFLFSLEKSEKRFLVAIIFFSVFICV